MEFYGKNLISRMEMDGIFSSAGVNKETLPVGEEMLWELISRVLFLWLVGSRNG